MLHLNYPEIQGAFSGSRYSVPYQVGRKVMLKHAFGEIGRHKLSFTLSLVLVMSFGIVLFTTNKASADG